MQRRASAPGARLSCDADNITATTSSRKIDQIIQLAISVNLSQPSDFVSASRYLNAGANWRMIRRFVSPQLQHSTFVRLQSRWVAVPTPLLLQLLCSRPSNLPFALAALSVSAKVVGTTPAS
jgi:hypothetical protein